MFTDMVGYSALSQRNEALALELLEEHRGMVRPLLAQHDGAEIKTIGDAFLVEFPSALAAVNCAVEIQRSLHLRNASVPAERQVRLRIGLHAGDVVARERDLYGDGVNIAARIEPLADAGGICVSEDVARQVQNKLPLALVRLGVGELKNIELPVAIYRVVLPWQKGRAPGLQRLAFLLAKRSVRRSLAVAALVVVAVVAVWWRAPHNRPGPINRLAVLPLVNFSGEARDEYFADGMTEELISSLASIRELSVIARTSVAKFKGARLDIREIGAALNVGSVLEGSVRLAAGEARVNVHLIEVHSQKTIWSHEFAEKVKDVFALQSAIAMSVTEALKVRLLAEERDRLGHRATASGEASREYLVGRAQLARRTSDEIVKAIGSLTRATEQDPTLAPAYAALAEAWTLAGVAGYGGLPREQAIEQARLAARRAVVLDESLGEAHAALAYVRFRIDWDWAGAEVEFRRALELKPGVAHTHELYGLYLVIQKRFAEAMAEIERAQQLDPLSPSVSNGVGRFLHFQGKLEPAVAQFRKTLELEPNFAEAHFNLGMTYCVMGRSDEALAELGVAIRLSNRPVYQAILALTLAKAGRHDEVEKIFADAKALASTSPVSAYHFGMLSLARGNLDDAFRYFNQAVDERDGILIYLPIEPLSGQIWADPRFDALVRRMNLRK